MCICQILEIFRIDSAQKVVVYCIVSPNDEWLFAYRKKATFGSSRTSWHPIRLSAASKTANEFRALWLAAISL
jgi:hypothetical protein